jgi:hypothetical protein
MTQGLDVSRVVKVDVVLSPQGAAVRNFGLLLLIGDSDVISGAERIRTYTDVDSVAADFGTSAPEYDAALLYFSQNPRPEEVQIGRWLRTATAGFLNGGILTTAEKTMANWTSITDGTFTIEFDGVSEDVTGLDFSAQTNLNGVAAIITAALTGGVMAWNGERFIATSDTTGVTSTVSYATTEGTGTDISAQLKLTSATADVPVDGFAAETPLDAVIALYDISSDWYMSAFAADTMPIDDQLIDVAAFIQAASISRVLFVTDTDTRELDAEYLTNISTRLQALEYNRSAVQYSQNKYAMASMAGILSGVDFDASNSALTVMFKTEPGVVAEKISETQANTLKQKRANVYVQYSTNNAIIQYGVMSYELYMDERQSFDWLQNAVQIAVFNLLLQSPKIGQTDAGITTICNAISGVLSQAVTNGMIAPGVWNGPSFGPLVTGQQLQSGFLVYAPPVSSQSQVDREARISVPIQCAIKLAGAIQEVDILINVNR